MFLLQAAATPVQQAATVVHDTLWVLQNPKTDWKQLTVTFVNLFTTVVLAWFAGLTIYYQRKDERRRRDATDEQVRIRAHALQKEVAAIEVDIEHDVDMKDLGDLGTVGSIADQLRGIEPRMIELAALAGQASESVQQFVYPAFTTFLEAKEVLVQTASLLRWEDPHENAEVVIATARAELAECKKHLLQTVGVKVTAQLARKLSAQKSAHTRSETNDAGDGTGSG
ncbi:MAG: hypothetical protein HY700_17310 [Gemmatimonadetes bacterium]|nr:hypothetical protein [Gemmatimonadota bacterium]